LPPINKIFHDDYRYSSSTIPSLIEHFKEYSQWISQWLPRDSHVLEFGCNDGILLKQLESYGYTCKGVDASANIAELARKNGIDVDIDFFGPDYVEKNQLEGAFDLVTCSNVYAHIDNLSQITIAVRDALKSGGLFAVEVHDGRSISTQGQFDTIYHEHLTYFTVETISKHLESYGFSIVSIANTSMHGAGLRVLSRLEKDPHLAERQNFQELPVINKEVIEHDLNVAHKNIADLKNQHHKLWGYGAAGRSQMFLNFTRTSDFFECVYDDSSLRQGRYIVGSDLKILPFDKRSHNGACIILAWNYAEDIATKIRPYFDSIYTVLPNVKGW
jgi:2-polyprenyl-3-methyl-5-hydroxy-6-metoxy-1,4-benzoquinol methylase